MNPLTFVTHPSVRIKGTENNYSPGVCQDHTCTNKSAHMHCPFCVRSESYQDPVILKAHYRVKHVDKGIEFAGLKVLRCCDHCDIVGVIKGEKRFKGAHWHCYKCRNGFNRRDEAIKHYKTHFRNPQTTFQIQIAQEVNQLTNASQSITVVDQDIIHPALTQAACLATTDQILTANGICKASDGTLQVSIAANETINTADGQTIMIISEEQLDAAQIENSFGTQIISTEDVGYLDHKQSLERKYESAEIRCQRLDEEKAQLTAEVEHYKAQIHAQAEEIGMYKRREQELVSQLQLADQISVQDLMAVLQQQHKDLLSAQLASLRHAFLARLPHELASDTDIVQEMPETYEIHINDDAAKSDVDMDIKEETGASKTRTEEEEACGGDEETAGGGDEETAGAEMVASCLVMCVEEEHGKSASEGVVDQSSLVVADMGQGDGSVTLVASEQSEVSGSHAEGLSEELQSSEPIKKKLRAM